MSAVKSLMQNYWAMQLVELLDNPLHDYFKQKDCLNYFFCFRWVLIQFKRQAAYSLFIFFFFLLHWFLITIFNLIFGMFLLKRILVGLFHMIKWKITKNFSCPLKLLIPSLVLASCPFLSVCMPLLYFPLSYYVFPLTLRQLIGPGTWSKKFLSLSCSPECTSDTLILPIF